MCQSGLLGRFAKPTCPVYTRRFSRVFSDLRRPQLHAPRVHQNSELPTVDFRQPIRHRSPHDPEPLVEAEFLVGSHNRDLFAQGLGNDLAVERVAMVQRQIEQMQRMISGVGQDSKPEVGNAREYLVFADSQLSYRLLDGNFRE